MRIVTAWRQRMGKPIARRKNDCRRWQTDPTPLTKYERRNYSQNGEDGIIERIFSAVPPLSKTFVEFGVEDGSECNTAYLVRHKGWTGLLIEGSPQKFARLQENFADYPGVKVVNRMITAENIVPIFEEQGISREFDLLSIDIDGNDYWVWKALAEYRPRVTIVEFNVAFPPPARWIMKYNPSHVWDDTSYYGASLQSMYELGGSLGYAFLGMDCNGVNAFFLRRDLLPGSGLVEPTPEEVYHYPPSVPRHPYRAGPFQRE